MPPGIGQNDRHKTVFKRNKLPALKAEEGRNDPSPQAIQKWFRAARQIVDGEDLTWIVNAADGIKENDQGIFQLPFEEESIDLERDDAKPISIEGETKRTICIGLAETYEAPAPAYDSCTYVQDYTSQQAAVDWKIMQAEITQFNSQMSAALESAGLPEIYERVNRGYGNRYHPLGGLMAWRMLADVQNADEGDDASSWVIKLQNAVNAGNTVCTSPHMIKDWMRTIDQCASRLMAHGIPSHTITLMTVHMVVNILELKAGSEWEPWRLLARDIKNEDRNKTLTWKVVNGRITGEYSKRFGTESVAAIVRTMVQQERDSEPPPQTAGNEIISENEGVVQGHTSEGDDVDEDEWLKEEMERDNAAREEHGFWAYHMEGNDQGTECGTATSMGTAIQSPPLIRKNLVQSVTNTLAGGAMRMATAGIATFLARTMPRPAVYTNTKCMSIELTATLLAAMIGAARGDDNGMNAAGDSGDLA